MRQFKYEKLACTLMNEIDMKIWRTNEKLPSIRVLAKTYCISKISVQKALHTLEARGVLYVKIKSGYYVSPPKETHQANLLMKETHQPKFVDVPELFYEIMERSAAFDIAPLDLEHVQTPNKILLLNRHITRAIRQKPQNKALYYSSPPGDMTLRHQISEHYRKRQLTISKEDVCITSGCQNSLFLALMVTCQPGDIVAVESPAFYGVLQLLHQLKLKVVEIPSSYTDGITSYALKEAASNWNIKACVITASFSTPTGALIPLDEKKKIVAFANEKNITLIEDDIYGDLGFHSTITPLKSFDTQGNVILCGSFSKSLSRDLRIGWIIANKHYKKIVHMKLVFQLSTSQAIQNGLASFLAEGHYERHLYQYRKTLIKQRDQLLNAIRDNWQTPIKYTIPDGGLTIWIQLPTEIDTLSLYEYAISEGIVITPGRLFSSSNNFSNCLRLSFAHPTTGHRLKALKKLATLCSVKKIRK